jgi:hypothetical protein
MRNLASACCVCDHGSFCSVACGVVVSPIEQCHWSEAGHGVWTFRSCGRHDLGSRLLALVRSSSSRTDACVHELVGSGAAVGCIVRRCFWLFGVRHEVFFFRFSAGRSYGSAMGILRAAGAISRIFGPFVAGFLYDVSFGEQFFPGRRRLLPFWAGALSAILAGVLIPFLKKTEASEEEKLENEE